MRMLATTGMTFMVLTFLQTAAFAQAKDLFYQQLDEPANQLNTGVQYWIELHRGAQTIHANNKTTFKSGDKIRFHIRPNINGYAYIVLSSGTTGKHAQLFPRQGKNDDNQITSGEEIIMPPQGVLTFDANPGVEKLKLMISRSSIDPESVENGGGATMVAMAPAGSKDLFADDTTVSYIAKVDIKETRRSSNTVSQYTEISPQPTKIASNPTGAKQLSLPVAHPRNTSQEAASATSSGSSPSTKKEETPKATETSKVAETSKVGETSKIAEAPKVTKSSKVAPTKAKVNPPKQTDVPERSAATLASTPVTKHSQSRVKHPTPARANLPEGLVTVVYKEPTGVLCCDIALRHL